MSKWGFIFEDEPEEEELPPPEAAVDDDPLFEEFGRFVVEAEPWKDMAACRGKGWQLFFLERGQSPRPAKMLCAICPVDEECWDYANRTASEGIWRGVTRDPRDVSKGVYVQIQDARPRRVV